MFSNQRPGSQVFLLEKGGQIPQLKIGQVEQISQPQPKYSTFTPGINVGIPNMNDLVVNIKVKFDDGIRDYNQVPANLSVADFGNGTILIDNKPDTIQEVEVMIQASKQALASQAYHENVLKVGDQMLRSLNPNFAKEAERDQAIGVLQQQVNDLTLNVNKLVNALNQSLNGNVNN